MYFATSTLTWGISFWQHFLVSDKNLWSSEVGTAKGLRYQKLLCMRKGYCLWNVWYNSTKRLTGSYFLSSFACFSVFREFLKNSTNFFRIIVLDNETMIVFNATTTHNKDFGVSWVIFKTKNEKKQEYRLSINLRRADKLVKFNVKKWK